MKITPTDTTKNRHGLLAYASIGSAIAFVMALTLGLFDMPKQPTMASNQVQIGDSRTQ